MPRRRILFVVETLRTGGTEVAMVTVAGALAKRGHRCRIVTLWPPATLADVARRKGVEVTNLGINHRWNVGQALFRLAREMRAFRPDVLHAQLFFAGLYAGLTRPLYPDAVRVVTFTNLGYDAYPATTAWLKLRKWVDGQVMRRGMDGHMAKSEAVRRSYERHLALEDVAVVWNAAPEEAFGDERPLDRAPGDGVPEVLCPATLRHEKGHRFLLRAMARLRERGVHARLVLAGDGPLWDDVARQRSELALDDAVHMVGELRHGALLSRMRAAQVVVLASTHEGLPVTALEALAVGTPMVATTAGGLSEVLAGDCGVLVPPADDERLADAIARALEDMELRRTVVTNGRARVWELAHPERVADRHEALYAEFAARRRTAGSRASHA